MSNDIERHIEDIHRELAGDGRDLSDSSPKTIKFYVRNLHTYVIDHLRALERQRDAESYGLTGSVVLLGCVGFLLAVMRAASSDIEWIAQHTLALRLWAVALSTIFVGISLERSTFVRSLWQFSITKLLLSLILSGVVFYARGKAAGFVNGVFHVDAGAFPITLALTTGIVLFKMLVPFAMAVAIVSGLAHCLSIAGWLYEKKRHGSQLVASPPLFSLLFVAVSGVILHFGSTWSAGELSDERIPERVYLMAHALDFNYTHECANVGAAQPVVFLGNTQESVLVAPFALEDFDFAEFFEASVAIPSHFARAKCEYKPAPEANPVGSQ